jgi:hypothetical protein
MCCEIREIPMESGSGMCNCNGSFRRFMTKNEMKECLEKYEKQLKNELAGVEERIRELKSK